jgi:regulator of sigma D
MSNTTSLRDLIRESIRKNRKKFMTFEGSEVEYGSQGHVDAYDQVLNELRSIRSQLTRHDRKEQDRITRCMESLRHLKRKAYKQGLTAGLIKEIDK